MDRPGSYELLLPSAERTTAQASPTTLVWKSLREGINAHAIRWKLFHSQAVHPLMARRGPNKLPSRLGLCRRRRYTCQCGDPLCAGVVNPSTNRLDFVKVSPPKPTAVQHLLNKKTNRNRNVKRVERLRARAAAQWNVLPASAAQSENKTKKLLVGLHHMHGWARLKFKALCRQRQLRAFFLDKGEVEAAVTESDRVNYYHFIEETAEYCPKLTYPPPILAAALVGVTGRERISVRAVYNRIHQLCARVEREVRAWQVGDGATTCMA